VTRDPGDVMSTFRSYWPVLVVVLLLMGPTAGQAAPDCAECHEPETGAAYADRLQESIHAGMGCTPCHAGKDVVPHADEVGPPPGRACRQCHSDVADAYSSHGVLEATPATEAPNCADCHGSHTIVAVTDTTSRVHARRQPASCNTCHGSATFAEDHHLVKTRLDAYARSVHGPKTSADGVPAATCVDCHSMSDNVHAIPGRGPADSPIHFFEVANTCGRCHADVLDHYEIGIHGRLNARGETDAPTCTTCHGEHEIVPTGAPGSPVSPTHVAGQTCAPCHESVLLNSRYGVEAGVVASFEDSYHGMKAQAGDTEVANCASCHGVHGILPPGDPRSRVHPDNLVDTCGACHEGISAEMAGIPIHTADDESPYHTQVATTIEDVYIAAIVIIIGLMVVHWLIDLARHLIDHAKTRPRVRRMRTDEVWMHAALALSFTVLVITGFALVYDQTWFATLLFGWEGGFAMRGIIHRIAAVLFVLTIVWHLVFLVASRRGRGFFVDITPRPRDFRFFFQQIAYNLRLRRDEPEAGRFTYVEKAEYWALVWGAAVMVLSGFALWFDDWLIGVLPRGSIEVAWVVHFWEAWLATLAIAVWHFYATIFKPEVYPMNPSWITGTMPVEQYREEHPAVWDGRERGEDGRRVRREEVGSEG